MEMRKPAEAELPVPDRTQRLRRPADMAAKIELLPAHPNRFRWTKRLLDMLGQIPDRQLAKMAGIHPQTVSHERLRRGVAAYAPQRSPIMWTDEMLGLLGTASDRAVAAMLGIGTGGVQRKRKLMNIAPFMEPTHVPEGYSWPPKALRLLGKMSDRDVAKRLGITATAVQFKRAVLSIAPFVEPNQEVVWTDEMLGLLGKIADSAFAKRFMLGLHTVQFKRQDLGIPADHGTSKMIERHAKVAALLSQPNQDVCRLAQVGVSTVYAVRRELGVATPDTRRKRWTPQKIAMLGKQPDAVVAARLEISQTGVSYMRRVLGIAAYTRTQTWTPAELALLGTASDQCIAEQLGCSRNSVEKKRRALRIASFDTSAT